MMRIKKGKRQQSNVQLAGQPYRPELDYVLYANINGRETAKVVMKKNGQTWC